MTTKPPLKLACGLALLALATLPARADLRPDGATLLAGTAPHGTRAVAAGLLWDWDWQAPRRALLTAHTELLVSHWRARALGGGHQSLQQLTLLPSLRLRPQRGAAGWFLEIGIGASWLSRSYRTPQKDFSSRWNFYDMLGVGLNLGPDRRQELGLRYVHVSNAGLRRPNPGEDFLLLRYARRF